ncbi:hypothetical protein [Salipiger abyssi]|uniref:hypothetical protein n=1 Tax=Salipiger abyssi TaxID=1250539 RepID=UPI001A8FA2CD|nr:hypothetical protein [Salipiger abyssi]MBN9890101.1 hypothetical protein [Salipiger abyssi]
MTVRKSPTIAFGLQVSAVALKAKAGFLTARDQLALVENMFAWADGDASARDAVRDFMALAKIDPAAAGRRLQDWLDGWSPETDSRRTEEVLAGIDAARPDWRARKDCGLE